MALARAADLLDAVSPMVPVFNTHCAGKRQSGWCDATLMHTLRPDTLHGGIDRSRLEPLHLRQHSSGQFRAK